MAQQTQFDALVAALQQTIAAQGHTGGQLAEAARAIADASTRMQAATTTTTKSGTSGTTFDTGSRVLKGPDVFAQELWMEKFRLGKIGRSSLRTT